ncbi:MAG: hypothetical protein RL376_1030, partial [Verrucomicrobiota bacterium]
MKLFKYIFGLTLLSAASLFAQDGWRRAVPDISQMAQPLSAKAKAQPSKKTLAVAAQQAQSVAAYTLSSGLAAADEVTPYIQSIADGLDKNPVRIYEWVKNNIDFTPYHGLKRGAQLTAIEKSGNDFDTAALLVALLKASGYTNIQYRFGRINIWLERPDGQDAVHWLGVDKSQVRNFLATAGCTYDGYDIIRSNSDLVQLSHVWVNLVMDGTTYVLTPAIKSYRLNQPVNLTSAGYSKDAVVAAAGGTLSSVSATPSGTSYTANSAGKDSLRSALSNYSVALSSLVQSDPGFHGKSGVELAGGKTLIPEIITSLPTNIIYGAVQDYFDSDSPWAQIPLNFCVKFTLNVGNLSQTWYTAELKGQKLALWFVNGGAQIWLDDTQVAIETNYTSTTPASVSFGYTYALNSNLTSSTSPDRTLARIGTGSDPAPCYVVSYGFDKVLGRLNHRIKIQADYISTNSDPYGRELRTENLYVMALQYLNQLATLNEIAGSTTRQSLYMMDHAGISGQIRAPYVDLPLNIIIIWPK